MTKRPSRHGKVAGPRAEKVKPAIGRARMKVTVTRSYISWNLLFGLWVLLSLCASGCSSIESRGESDYYPGVYPGVKYHQTEYRWGEPKDEQQSRREGSDPDLWREGVSHRIAGFFDFPFTLVFDTVLLPWDLPYWAFHKPSTNTISKCTRLFRTNSPKPTTLSSKLLTRLSPSQPLLPKQEISDALGPMRERGSSVPCAKDFTAPLNG